jgi:integrase-like protein
MFSIAYILFSRLHKEFSMLQRQSQPPKLLDQVRTAIRTRHYSIRTEATYLSWIKRFIVFHGKRHPRDMGV